MQLTFGYVASGNSRRHQASDWSRNKRRGRRLDIKCQQLLKDKKTYKPIGYNPTSGYRKQVTDFVNKVNQEGGIDNSLKFKLTPPTEPIIPAFYGLPKVHKPEPIPVRPIISTIGSVTYNLAKHAA